MTYHCLGFTSGRWYDKLLQLCEIVTASSLPKESVYLAIVHTVFLFKIEIKKNWSNLEYYSPVGLNMLLLNNLSFPWESIVNIIDIFTNKNQCIYFR